MNVAIPLTLHKNQELIHQSLARYVVVKSGKRFGKTELALYKLIKGAWARPGGTFWYMTDTATHAKEISWKRLLQLLPKVLVKRVDNQTLSITLVNDSTIKLIGSENSDALRGVKLHGIVWEEAAYVRDGMEIWSRIIFGQLQGVGDEAPGWAFFISSPNRTGANWFSNFYTEALRKKVLGDTDWDAFKFTIYDNPLYKKEVIEAIKEGCTEDEWEVEYLANESAHAGQIVSEFDYSLHVGEFEIPKDCFLTRAVDWGIAHPTACLWMYVDVRGNMVYLSDEYKKSGKTIEESCSIIKQISGKRAVEWSVIDPSMAKRDKYVVGKREMDEFARHGVPCVPGDNRDYGYDTMKMFFKKNRIKIKPTCPQIINEIKNVQWGDKVGEDLLDCLRYGLQRINDIYFHGNIRSVEESMEKLPANNFNLHGPLFGKGRAKASEMSWAYAEDAA